MIDRHVEHRYDDPVDLIWIRAAADLGLTIRRSAETFAAYDGQGTLTICDASHFDADDCLAQMIFHEICHWLVAGRRGQHLEDWGLSNVDDRDLVFEYAAIRLQAAISHPYGLREFMAVTTDWRPYWETLPLDPLRDGEDPAIPLAQEASHLARLEPFQTVLARSLSATAAIADTIRDVAPRSSLWSVTRARHRLGSLAARDPDLQCGACAWAVAGASGLSCRQHKTPDAAAPLIEHDEPACERWEPPITIEHCGACGACCRQGFDVVTMTANDPFKTLHPELVQIRDDGEACVPRPDGVCVALSGNGDAADLYRCRHYENRPQNCVDFEVAGDACLLARRRVGISR